MIKMPPQAYTKEVLTAAFDWLSSQPEYVRQKITSSDDLVGLYLKSTRLKQDFNKDLSSAKSFRNELQDLAQNLKQFEEKEEPPVKPTMPSRMAAPQLTKEELAYHQGQAVERAYEGSQVAKPHTPTMMPTAFHEQEVGNPLASSTPTSGPVTTSTPASTKLTKLSEGELIFKLDSKTISALNLAKDRLNLSSDTEALRVLVSLGEKHLKRLFAAED
ncbi:MAG: hypothetical protein M9899_02565 [Bdellovibrionaceae bacterium]|nr:hypothetical protein [Pseudobdellovibrionaceae bacterium]